MNLSEAEDDPESYESSEDEWVETEKKTTRRRTTRKNAKKPKKSLEVDDSSDSTSEPNKPKNGVARKKKSPSKNSPNIASTKKSGHKVIHSNNFAVGSFVIAKSDAQVGDPNKQPWIWRIDGKSLLQKYEPFEHEGKIRHKNTSVYTGWSPMDTDDYAPLTVDLIEQTEGQVVVELHAEELKKIIQNDSE